MVRWLWKRIRGGDAYKSLIFDTLAAQDRMESLPALSELERAKLEQEMAIDHLYYSSKIEGTILTKPQIENAIHAKDVQASTAEK